MTRFGLTAEPIDPDQIRPSQPEPETGSVVCFEGRVRNHHRGRGVTALSYSAYVELCLTEGQSILDEAENRFAIHSARAVHRYGPIPIGECAVWIEIESSHRADGFEACRYVIDEMKKRLPIWKHETYEDGTSEWVQPE